MIRVTFNAPVMDAALIDIEEAVGLESVAVDDWTALFDGPAMIAGDEVARIARRVRALVEISAVSEGDVVMFQNGAAWRVVRGKWQRFRGHA